ncbi:MAG: hypothetical protein H7282_09935 [Cytophagaceae bacterium]|nr:hypothetical protein [Cytophagaceae bacterium]
MNAEYLKLALLLCGIGHIVLSIASMIIPKALQWKKELNKLPVLLKQLFWTYAAYILVINFSFGIISIYGTEELMNHSFLAKSITLFISIYWAARVLIQFFYFDTTNAPKGFLYKAGEVMLILLFVLFTAVYFVTFLYNHS